MACEVARPSRKAASWGYTISSESPRPKHHLWWHARWQGSVGWLSAGAISSVVKVQDQSISYGGMRGDKAPQEGCLLELYHRWWKFKTRAPPMMACDMAKPIRNPESLSSLTVSSTVLYINNSQMIAQYILLFMELNNVLVLTWYKASKHLFIHSLSPDNFHSLHVLVIFVCIIIYIKLKVSYHSINNLVFGHALWQLSGTGKRHLLPSDDHNKRESDWKWNCGAAVWSRICGIYGKINVIPSQVEQHLQWRLQWKAEVASEDVIMSIWMS